MTHFKLGDIDKAREELGQLRALMADPTNADTFAKDADARAFLKEAEELIDPKPVAPLPVSAPASQPSDRQRRRPIATRE